MPYIASGTYGCVFYPPVECTNSKKRLGSKRIRSIGKIFGDSNQALSEQQIHSLVDSIDPQSKFTLRLIRTCNVDHVKEKHKPEKCHHMKPTVERYQQLIYEHGGKSYDDIMKDNKPTLRIFKKLVQGLLPIFEGITILLDNGYIHQDIKPANITYFAKVKSARLIDFGIMINKHKIYSRQNEYVLIHPYPYYPPEFKLQFAHSLRTFQQMVLNNFDSAQSTEDVLYYCGVDFELSLQETFRHKSMPCNKVDSYSLGIVLATILAWSQLLNKTTLRKNTILMLQDLQELIRLMCHQDSKKRIDAFKAYEVFQQFISSHF